MTREPPIDGQFVTTFTTEAANLLSALAEIVNFVSSASILARHLADTTVDPHSRAMIKRLASDTYDIAWKTYFTLLDVDIESPTTD